MNAWELQDYRNPIDHEEEIPTTILPSERELRAQLTRLCQEDPAEVLLLSPHHEWLSLGIGGPWAGVHWGKAPLSHNYQVALANRIIAPGPVGFANQGEVSIYDPDELLPVAEAIEVAAYFYNHHRLAPWIAWKRWNPTTSFWEVVPATARAPETAPVSLPTDGALTPQ